jgi:hypothetical protein
MWLNAFSSAVPRGGEVLIGAYFAPEVRTTLRSIAAQQTTTMKQLLGEAINDLSTKYGYPPPCRDESTLLEDNLT